MLRPSDVDHPNTYRDIEPDTIVRYLIKKGWREIYAERDDRRGIAWFYHPIAPRWKGKDLATNTMIPNALMAYFATEKRGTIVGGGTLVRVTAKRYVDYPQANWCIIHDLEIHENRWIGLILEEIQTIQTTK